MTELEIDHAHRAQGPKDSDPMKPRDVICRIHFFHSKENIMAVAWLQRTFDYDGAQLIFLQDLSRYTLMMRKAVKPLLESLREKEILYRWGFPFQIIVHQNGQKITFQDIGDLPDFRLQLPIFRHGHKHTMISQEDIIEKDKQLGGMEKVD